MNVIIRLQNLPWSANATDIRTFFKGLMIPEGGVHIVGGENGDAFIAFSSDEDARQAMQMNGGKLKETQVSLLLSSRAEMQKVIEKARQAVSAPFMNKISAAPTPQVLSAATIANQFAKKFETPSTIVPPQPPIISLTNFLTQSMQQNTQNAPVSQAHLLSAYNQMPPNEISGITGLNSVPPMTSALGIQQNAASAAAAAYANYYATLIDPNALNYVNTISAGLTSKPAIESHVLPTMYNSDPRNRRSNSHERNSFNQNRSPERKRRDRSTSRDRFADNDKDGRDISSRRRTRFSAVNDRLEMNVPNISSHLPNQNKSHVAAYSIPPPASNSIWDNPPPQVFSNSQNPQIKVDNCFAMFNGNSSLPPTRHYQTENNKPSSSSEFGDIGTCIKVSNADNETYYSDLRKFFGGLPIGQNDIKFLTDAKGNRTGIVLIRFLTSDSKKKALTKSMWQLKSTQVMITSITEEEFESGLMNIKSSHRVNYNRNDDHQDSRNDRYRERSRSRDRDNQKSFNRHDNGNRNNRFDDRNNRDQGNFREKNQKNFRYEEQNEKPKEFKPDEDYKVLVIDDIPRVASEPDICEAFPNIVSIVIDRYTAFVKFATHEAAKMTLENRFIHYIRNKRVFLEAGSEAQFNERVRKLGKFDNPEADHSKESENGSENKFNSESINDDSNSRDSMRNRDQKPFESRDPRQRNFSNDRFNNGPPLKTDCVIIKNMETDTKIEDVEDFFKEVGIYQTRVHILLDKKGQPCGDCFVELKHPNEAQKAVTKNNQMMKNNRVQVMMIPREQVEAVLSSFGGNDDRPQRGPRPDWAPPKDFGFPGCVLMISNLSYRAEIEDILEEFREFNLGPDQIIRRFNDMGKPTGNACINFNSPEDADLALEKYNSVQIMNRPVWLKRV